MAISWQDLAAIFAIIAVICGAASAVFVLGTTYGKIRTISRDVPLILRKLGKLLSRLRTMASRLDEFDTRLQALESEQSRMRRQFLGKTIGPGEHPAIRTTNDEE